MKIKYGDPSTSEKDESLYSSDWFFNSTIISLKFFHIKSLKLYNLAILYEKAKQGFDFRHVKWGYSRKQVLLSEKMSPIIDTSNILGYETTVAGMKCLIGYIFANDKLTRAKYIFEEEHSNKNNYIEDYYTLKKLLTKKYGEPLTKDEGEVNWTNDLYKDDVQQWGFAVSLGQLYFYNHWITQKTNISLMLTGENYKIDLIIEYVSKQYEGLEKKIKEKKTLNEF